MPRSVVATSVVRERGEKYPGRLRRPRHPDLGLLMPGLFPVRHVLGRQAMPLRQVYQSLRAVVEVLTQHLVLSAFGAVEREVKEPARRHDPSYVSEALLDH